MGRRPTGVPGLPDDLRAQARAWAEETAVAQGFPARVERPDVLRAVAVLLGSSAGRAQARQTGVSRDGRSG